MRCRPSCPRAGCTPRARAPAPSGSQPASRRRRWFFDPAGAVLAKLIAKQKASGQAARRMTGLCRTTCGLSEPMAWDGRLQARRAAGHPSARCDTPARVGADRTGLQRPDAWCRYSQFCAIGCGGACQVDLTIDVSSAWQKIRGKRYVDETRAPSGACLRCESGQRNEPECSI